VRIFGVIVRLFALKHVAPVLLPFWPAHLSFSLACAKLHEENRLKMIRLVRQLVIVAMLGVVSAGAFAQRKDQDKRPPKEPVKVITNDRKDNRPPPRNTNQPPKPDNRKRPE
jgi:hypothetical protein